MFFCHFVARSDRKEVYLGDDNALTLTFNARNEGEGGAYEAELYVILPAEADYSGIARNNEVSHIPHQGH